MQIPCLKKRGLKIFAPTADQRYLLGEELFLRTHFPLTFRRYRGHTLVETWSEQDILGRLKESTGQGGNRVFILFGAAGSGKSESIRWLEFYLRAENSGKSVFRISRTELDPVLILEKLIKGAGNSLDRSIMLKWDALRKKPVALANTLVWNALNAMLNSDEEIIPISYKLRPLVENNLRRSFLEGVCGTEGKVELLSLEEWEEIKKDCAIDFDLEYEQFRKRLVEKFDAEVLGGHSFIGALKTVGEKIWQETGQRPVLFVDDLVQSMTIYSSDLLDFFITLEEGNWDIVIGLTPASFESSKRGRELLGRINHLDTFDDRIHKLWLTDEFGHESYTIDNESVAGYIGRYLAEFKRVNGFDCGRQCDSFTKCASLQWGHEEDVILTPLNSSLVRRMFDNLFKGKGQSRHIVVTVSEYLSAIMAGEAATFLSERVTREKNTDIEDLTQKVLVEAYLPAEAEGELVVPDLFFTVLGYKRKKKNCLNITNLGFGETALPMDLVLPVTAGPRPELAAVRDWLENREVNKELLKAFRLSCNSFLREFLPKTGLVRPYTSRPQGSIRCDTITEGCRFPLVLQAVDSYSGINVSRSLGPDAFHLLGLREQGGDAQQAALDRLWSKCEISRMIAESGRVVTGWRAELEESLSLGCGELAFLLYVFAFHVFPFDSYPLLIDKNYKRCTLREVPSPWDRKVVPLADWLAGFISDYFKDWFQLRENFYDAFLLNELIAKYPEVMDVFEAVAALEPERVPTEYRVGNSSLREVLADIVVAVRSWLAVISDDRFREDCETILLELKNLSSLDENEMADISKQVERVETAYVKLGKIATLARPPLVDVQTPVPANPEFPENIAFIARYAKDPCYLWLSSLKEQLLLICTEYGTLCRSFREVFPGLTEAATEQEYRGCPDIRSLLSLAEDFAGKSALMIDKINLFNQVRECMAPDYLAAIEDFAFFLDNLQSYLPFGQQEQLGLVQVHQLARSYLDEVHFIKDRGEFAVDREAVREAFIRLNKERMRKLKKSVCRVLANQIRSSLGLTAGQRTYLWGDKTLIRTLILAGKDRYHNYPELAARLEKRRKKYGQNLDTLTGYLSAPAVKMMTDLFGQSRVRLRVDDYWLLAELSSKAPHLAENMECEIIIKA
ncbi:MAG: hypothetical protein KGZ79_07730 [Dethiobacter sp.]|nr:hypothetical protein [Dethiobacter sp.]